MYNLLNIYRCHVGNETKMKEVQHKIEMLSLSTFSDPSQAYIKYPVLMSLLIKSEDVSAKKRIYSSLRA